MKDHKQQLVVVYLNETTTQQLEVEHEKKEVIT